MENKTLKIGLKFTKENFEKFRTAFEWGDVIQEDWDIIVLLTLEQKKIVDEYLSFIPDMAIFSILASKVWYHMLNEVRAGGCNMWRPELRKVWKWKYLLEFSERRNKHLTP